jgi:hypothetical protein
LTTLLVELTPSSLASRAIYDDQPRAHCVTFSCYRRRRPLDDDHAKRVVLGALNSRLASRKACCLGQVLMPDRVHAIIWCPLSGQWRRYYEQGQSAGASIRWIE